MEKISTQKISTCLWFDGNGEEAANYYISIFENGKINKVVRTGENGPVITVSFQLLGQDFLALNGGPMFKFSEAISFIVNCENQDELDKYWDKLSEGGATQQCGWLKDKFGLSWQIVPSSLGKMMQTNDVEKSGRVMQALMKMVKLDIKKLEDAFEG